MLSLPRMVCYFNTGVPSYSALEISFINEKSWYWIICLAHIYDNTIMVNVTGYTFKVDKPVIVITRLLSANYFLCVKPYDKGFIY